MLIFCIGGAKIGDGCIFYAPTKTRVDETSLTFLEMGNYVQITEGVVILVHDYSYSVCARAFGKLPRVQRATRIGNNVFIGMNSIILMGADIRDNVIIGAGSVVTGICQENSVYAGNPAKRICSLEDHCRKNEKLFLESARVWCQQYYLRKGHYPQIDEMGLYKSLFIDKTKESVEINFKNSDFKESILKMPKLFDSIEEMMNYSNDEES